MEAELKIGDEGETGDVKWTRYQVVAVGVLNGSAIVRLYRHGGLTMVAEVREGMRTTNGVTLLPPKPETETLRRWLWMCNGELRLLTRDAVAYRSLTRPADITYTPDGRIVSITFADEVATEPPASLDLKTGDVVRLRNGDEERIEGTDGLIHGADQPIYGPRYHWWNDGRYSLTREESGRDIVAVVNRADPTTQPCGLCGEIWERVRKVSDAASWNDLREAVDDVVGLLNDCGYGGGNAQS